MYLYDTIDQTLVDERVAQFRDQVRRRLDGTLSEDEFRPLRLMNGLYLQLHAYMLRVAIPYGLLSSEQLRTLAHVARTYDRGFGHFTTRQNIQYNWLELPDVPDVLADLARVEMHAIQTSGNCIRNVTADQYAGVADDEIEDPRPWCEIIRQWSTFHPEFSYLPRKFKIAVTGARNDRAAVMFHDIGIRIVERSGERGFQIVVGGGLGRTPVIGKVVREFLPQEHLLSYLEAIMRVYNLEGRRDNIYKARIKILVNDTGEEGFRAKVEEEWAHILEEDKDGDLALPQGEIARMKAFFVPPAYRELPAETRDFDAARAGDRAFASWARTNVIAHKVPGYSIAVISLKPHGGTPGDATDAQMDAVADLADEFSFGQIIVTHEQNLVLTDVETERLHELWSQLRGLGLATPNIGLLTNMITCPGLDYCSLANARSIPIAQQIGERFDDLDFLHDLGEIDLNISGCINACAHHHVGHIGILGVDRKGEEYYQILIGGESRDAAAIGQVLGPSLPRDRIVDGLDRVLRTYLDRRQDGERFIDTVRRIGVTPFKESLYVKAD